MTKLWQGGPAGPPPSNHNLNPIMENIDICAGSSAFAPRRSMSFCRLADGGESQFQIVIGFCPIWGFGNLTPGATDLDVVNGTAYNTIWPFVFNVQTETVVIGTSTETRVTTWQNCADVPYTVVLSSNWGAGGWNPALSGATALSISADGTTGVANYGGGNSYTVVLSSQFTASSGWIGATASALALMNNVALPSILPPTGSFGQGQPNDQNRTQVVVPVTTGLSASGWVVVDSAFGAANNLGGFGAVCAAANGLPVMCQVQTGTVWPYQTYPASIMALNSIVDVPGNAGPGNPNIGGVVCIKSRWRLAGTGDGIYDFFTSDTDHKTINGMRVDFGALDYRGWAGQPELSSVVAPTSFQSSGNVYASSVLVADPITRWPQVLTFLPSDVKATLFSSGSSNQYGLLGFRTTPV